MAERFPKFVPESQSLDNWLELMSVAFRAQGINDEARQVSLILTHVPTQYFDDIVALIAPGSALELTLNEVKYNLKTLFKPKKTIVKHLSEFQDRVKSKDESYNIFFKDLNRLAEFCDFGHKEEFLKYKLFLAARSESYFTAKLSDFDYHSSTVGDLLAMLSNLEAAYQEQKVDPGSTGIYKIKKDKCKVCGKNNHTWENCHLKNATCFKCNQSGHVATVCKSKTKSTERRTYVSSKEARQHMRSPKGNIHGQSKTHEIAVIEEDTDESFELNCNYNSVDPYVIHCTLNNQKLPFEVDTGSAISTLKYNDFKKLHCPLHDCKIKLQGYNQMPIKVFGKVKVSKFLYKNNKYSDVEFIVVSSDVPNNLIGRNLITKCNMINIHQLSVRNFTENYNVDNEKPIRGYQAQLYPKPGHVPIFQKARTVPLKLRSEVEGALKELESTGVIEKVEFSDYASPIVPVRKQNGSLRVCGDFRKINEILHESKFPLPNMAELISNVSGHQFYTKLDLKNAYLQIEVVPDDCKYLVINTHLGLYKYLRLPFGIHSSPAIFQKFISQLLASHEGTHPYLDDIIVGGDSIEEHDQRLSKVLETLQAANVQLNFKKSVFRVTSVKYLGFKLSSKGYEPDEEKVRAILDVPVPTNVTELKSFLGFISFYHSFVKNFATIASPLYDLTKKGVDFVWSRQTEESFNTLKSAVAAHVSLNKFDVNAKLIVEVDASPMGVGAVLLQQHQDGSMSTISFASRRLTVCEQNYAQIDREGLAVVFALNKYSKFLLGRKFVLRTDHRPLIHIFNPSKPITKIANARLIRWSVLLLSFDYTIEHLPGIKNTIADCLSRLPIEDNTVKFHVPHEIIKLINVIDDFKDLTIDKLREATLSDSVLSQVKSFVRSGFPRKLSNMNPQLEPYYKIQQELSIHNELLLYRNRIVIPEIYRAIVMKQLHAGHPGTSSMRSSARTVVFWPNMDLDLDQITKSCTECFANNSPKGIKPSKWPETPLMWQRLHVDWCGPIDGYYFIVIIDSKSKFLDVHASKGLTSSKTVEHLRRTFSNFGLPEELVSDNGPCFISKEFKSFVDSNNIKHILSAPYHPQSNGLAERAVQVFKRLFLKFTTGDINCRLSRLLYHYRCTVQSTTGHSPAELLFSRPFKSALDRLKPLMVWSNGSKDTNINSKFHIGDAVFIKNFGVGAEWLPGNVIEVINNRNYKVKLTTDNVICKRHISQLFQRQIPAAPVDCEGAVPSNFSVSAEKLPHHNFSDGEPIYPPCSDQEKPTNPTNIESNVGECPQDNIIELQQESEDPYIVIPNHSPQKVTRSGRTSKPPCHLNL